VAAAEKYIAEKEAKYIAFLMETARLTVDAICFDNGIRHDEGEG